MTQDWRQHEDALDRMVAGAPLVDTMPADDFIGWLLDLEVAVERAVAKVYPVARVEQIGDAIRLAERLASRRADGRDVMQRFTQTLKRLIHGSRVQSPPHLAALEHKWRAFEVASHLVRTGSIQDQRIASMQPATAEALRVAEVYCWGSSTVEAVASAAESLPDDCRPNVTALGDLASAGRAGFWWFAEPLPIQTTATADDEVNALLWRYEAIPGRAPRIWFSTFTSTLVLRGGRTMEAVVPTTAWIWDSDTPVGALPADFAAHYADLYAVPQEQRPSIPDASLAGKDQTVRAAVWFSRFFLAAATWLRQRVVSPEPAQGVRQVSRQLQREHRLREAPRVQLVELRRREVIARHAHADEGASGRVYSCRFVVHGFMRNQWYPSRGEHAPKWIDSYIKGPDGAPLKESARVYVVRR